MNHLPAPLRPRHDGWTPARQWAFLQALGDTGSVTRAAARVGLSVQAAYALRRHPSAEDFRTAWEGMLAESLLRIEETVMDRAINGELETYERDGVVVTRHRPCSPKLLAHLLDRAERRRAAVKAVRTPPDGAAVARLRAEIAALAHSDRSDRSDEPDYIPEPIGNDETEALRRLHALVRDFVALEIAPYNEPDSDPDSDPDAAHQKRPKP